MKKFISILLTLTMIISFVPMFVYANDIKTIEDSEEYNDISIVEQEEKRTENSKTYLTSKGTYISVITSDPITFEKDGKYVDIDNTIVEKNKSYLTNKECDYNIDLPKTYKNGDSVVISKDNYTISLSIKNALTKSKSKIHSKNDRIEINSLEGQVYSNLEVQKTTSIVEYDNIFNDVNLEYQVMPNAIKEDFILKKRPKNDFSIEYLLDAGNLDLVLNEDLSISLLDDKKSIFTIESPVMYDADFKTSNDFEVLVEKSEKGYLLQYKPNMDWINNKSTIYPVTIDPDITIDNSATISDSSYLSSIAKLTCYNTEKNIYVQNSFGESGTVREAHLQVNSLPNIDDNCSISNATLGVYKYSTNGTTPEQNTIKVSALNTTYDASQLNYNRRANYDSDKYEFLDMKSANSSEGYMTFNITSAVEDWINNSATKKILALQGTPSTTTMRFGSSRANSISEKPYITIEYIRNPDYDLTNGNSIHSVNMGLAGTAYINDATGKINVDSNIFDYSGQSSWLKFALTMGNGISASGVFGDNAEYKYFETLKRENNSYVETFSNNSEVLYEHSDGNNYVSSLNQKAYSIYTNADGNLVLEENIENNNLDNSYSQTKIFNEDNNIISLSCKTVNGNTTYTNFSYDNDGKLSCIVDSTNAKFQFNYLQGKVNQIVYSNNRNDNGSISTTDGTFDSVNMTMDFSYVDNHISTITTSTDGINGSTTVSYYWNADTIYGTVNENNIKTICNYSEDGQLESIYEYSVQANVNSSQQELEGNSKLLYSFEYGDLQTIITNNNGNKIIEYFDETGNLIKTCNQDGEIEFISSLDENFKRKSSAPTNYKINYIKNGDFESEKDSCFALNNGRTISDEAYTGNHSLYVNSRPTELSTNVTVDKKDVTYTVSCWVKSSDNNSRASISLKNSELITSSSETIQCDDEWKQLSCSINATDESLILTITVSGKVFIDAIKVENGLNATSKNYITNYDFSKGTTSWQTSSSQAISVNSMQTPRGCDNSALLMQNDLNTPRYAIQYIQGPFRAGEKITFSGYVKTDNTLPTSDDGSRFIEMRICPNTSGQILDDPLSTAEYNIKDNDWQFMANEVEFEENCSGIYVALISKGLNGNTYFDGVSLYKNALYVAEYSPITDEYDTEILGYELVSKQTNETAENVSKPNDYSLDSNIVSITDASDALTLQINDIVSNTLPTNKYRQVNCYDNYEDLLILSYDKFGPSSACKYNIFKNPAAFLDITSYYNECKCNLISDEYGKIRIINYGQDYSSIKNDGIRDCIVFNYNGSKLTSIGFLYEIDDETIDDNTIYFDENGIFTSDFYNLINTNTETILSFEYNKWSDLSAVYYGTISPENLGIQYIYDDISNNLSKLVYRDGTIINYVYDYHNNLVNVYDNLTDATKHIDYKYYYFDNNEMYANCNLVTGNVKSFFNGVTKEYNLNDDAVYHTYGMNSNNEMETITSNIHSKTKFIASGNTVTSNYKFYDFDNELSKKGSTVDEFDDFGRLVKREFKIGNEQEARFYAEYSYLNSTISEPYFGSTVAIPENILAEIEVDDNSVIESDLVREVTYYSVDENNNSTRMYSYRYLYDTDSNVISSSIVKDGVDNEILLDSHLYDYEDGKLTMEVDVSTNTSYIYEYDGNNLVSKKTKPFVSFGSYTTTTLENLDYLDSEKLTEQCILASVSNYNGSIKSISTSDNGNIIRIGDDRLYYSTDNKLTSFSNQNETVSINYNAEGKISEKSNGNSVQKYYWNNNQLSSVYSYEINSNEEISNEKIVTILYDIDNRPYGFVTSINGNSRVYFYMIDPCGKIIGVLNENGEEIIKYNYDAWGRIEIPSTFISTTGNSVTANQNIIKINPLVYYSNIYDDIMEMYYIDGRFYSPELYRFVSKKDTVSTNFVSFTQLNPYLYNNNRPLTKKLYNVEDVLKFNSIQLYEETIPGLRVPVNS